MSGTGKELLEKPEVRAAYLEGGSALRARQRMAWASSTRKSSDLALPVVTCMLGGAAAWMTGRACALNWRIAADRWSLYSAAPRRRRTLHPSRAVRRDAAVAALLGRRHIVVLVIGSIGFSLSPCERRWLTPILLALRDGPARSTWRSRQRGSRGRGTQNRMTKREKPARLQARRRIPVRPRDYPSPSRLTTGDLTMKIALAFRRRARGGLALAGGGPCRRSRSASPAR